MAIVRYLYIVNQNAANAEYFIWRLVFIPCPSSSIVNALLQYYGNQHRRHVQLHAFIQATFRLYPAYT